jgi:hypothetical protein
MRGGSLIKKACLPCRARHRQAVDARRTQAVATRQGSWVGSEGEGPSDDRGGVCGVYAAQESPCDG